MEYKNKINIREDSNEFFDREEEINSIINHIILQRPEILLLIGSKLPKLIKYFNYNFNNKRIKLEKQD